MLENRLLTIKNLSISFFSNGIEKEIIHNISYHLNTNEILGIVGESGSGKSVSSLAILGLLPNKISKINITESSPIATTVETELNSPTGLAFDNNTTILYISEIDGNKISKFDFSLLSTSDILNLRNKISVYPNPSKYFIKIVGLNKNENYIIYNSLGVEITNGSVFNNQKININNLTNGLYVLKFENRNVIKFIKD